MASFHGHCLVTDAPDSPHLQASKTKAKFPIAIGDNDDKSRPTEKDVLKDTFAKAKLPAEIEVYMAAHGWCPPDTMVYNREESERAWARLLALYGKLAACRVFVRLQYSPAIAERTAERPEHRRHEGEP